MKRRVCQHCGKSFLIGSKSTAKYCSRACRVSKSTNPARFYKQGIYLSKAGIRYAYDSSMEELWMKMADEKGISWARAEHVRIPYFNPRLRRQAMYEPDFLVKSSEGYKIIELKPYGLINDQVVQAKAAAARKWCRENGYIYEIVCSPNQH